jgi:hypothetical protein
MNNIQLTQNLACVKGICPLTIEIINKLIKLTIIKWYNIN